MTKEKRLHVTINNREYDVRPNLSILQAALENNVYIPSLCAFEHLSSYGACRLCVVEVDGLRGFPTSCTTPVEAGMVIRTDSAEIRSLRQEILKLLLSEHPASCLFCDEQDGCKEYQGTIRKVGVTTGCRYCPNDARCDLQEITEKIGLTETSYPVYYRNLPVEKYDPFYDRDYNLCILCGRCVRVCSDLRLNATLSFKQRGKVTTVGPAFDRSHVEAGCEFCGACVSVCPTGALSVKVSKWYGKPENQEVTTCVYCSVGCQVLLQTRDNEVIDALPDYSSSVDHGLICVKGRFAITEYVHSPRRILQPRALTPDGYENISWERAIGMAAERLTGLKADDCLMMVAPELSNEDLFAAQEFMRHVMGSENIGSSVMAMLGGDLGVFLDLVTSSQPLSVIDEAEAIVTVGFDSLYGYSPIGIAAKKAALRGAAVITVNGAESNLDMLSEVAFNLESRDWAGLLNLTLQRSMGQDRSKKGTSGKKADKRFADLLSSRGDDVSTMSERLSRSSHNVLVVGPDVLWVPERREILEVLRKMRDALSWKMIVAHPFTNLSGMLAMGAFPDVKPGEALDGMSTSVAQAKVTIPALDLRKKRRVLYLVGEVPNENLPDCDYLIYQNVLESDGGRRPDLILPAASFAESEGTVINSEGRLLKIRKAVEPQGESKPDWWILSRIARAMKKGKPNYQTVAAIQGQIRKFIKGFPGNNRILQFSPVDGSSLRQRSGTMKRNHVHYRGVQLSQVVAGMKVIEGRDHE